MREIKEKDGFIRVKHQTKIVLEMIKRNCGSDCSCFDELINVILKCPQLPNFVYDYYQRTSFQLSLAERKRYEKQNKIDPSGLIAVIPKRIEVIKK